MSKSVIEVKKSQVPAEQRADPWQSFRQEMNRLMNRFDVGFHWPSFGQGLDVSPLGADGASFEFNIPLVDVAEDEKGFTLTAELPGLDQKDIEVTVSNHRLTLKGEKRREKEEKDKNHYLSERCYGSFERRFTLPEEVEGDKIAASFSKGVLTITLPKTAEAQKQKKIEVKAA
jgi:HSP20 family protein